MATNQLIQKDIDLVTLAREIAIDHYDIDDVLTRYQLSYDAWRLLLEYPRFMQLLANEEEAWQAAKNTKERVRLKSAAVIEKYLEAAQASLHDKNETLVAKTGLAKLVAGFAGLGEGNLGNVSAGSGFSITINLGDQTLNIGAGNSPKTPENEGFEGENEGFLVENDEFPVLESSLDVYEINRDLG